MSAGVSPSEGPSVRALTVQILVIQTVVLGLARLASSGAALSLTWRSTLTPLIALETILLLVGVLFLAWLEARKPLDPRDTLRIRLRQIAVRDPIWIAVTLGAGFVEEYAYRGVLTALLEGVLPFWAAALVSAVFFGAAHGAGGWRSAIPSVGFALVMQALVWISGGLLLAVFAHAAYDLLAAWLGHRLAPKPSQMLAA